MNLITLASKQIWPQVLSVMHLKPERVLLLHSNDQAESKGPAQRLKRFFDKHNIVPKGGTHLGLIPHDDFNGVEHRLDELAANYQLKIEDTFLNFTGGNKLMATAAFRWATAKGMKSFYLERGQTLTWFEPHNGNLQTRTEKLDGRITNELDPVALLRCHLDASELERPGQILTLNQAGREISIEDLWKQIKNGNDACQWLEIKGKADPEEKKGDSLEYATAAVVLKLGVKCAYRSLRLKVKSAQHVSTMLPHAEIDLLFNWNGRLWLVDCKDRKPVENLIEGLRREIKQTLSSQAEKLLHQIGEELEIGQTKAMKLDLVAIREMGGLLGKIVCVRKAELPEQALQYAKYNQIEVVLKRDLVEGLRALLFPGAPPTQAQLDSLSQAFRPTS